MAISCGKKPTKIAPNIVPCRLPIPPTTIRRSKVKEKKILKISGARYPI